MSREYQVEKAIVPGSFLEEEFLQMLDFSNPGNIFLAGIDYADDAVRSTKYALHGIYGITLFCPLHYYAPTSESKVAGTLALKASPKIKMAFTFYTADFIDKGYIEFELSAPNLPGLNAFTATVKIDGSDKKIYIKDIDDNYQEVGTIVGFRNYEWYTLACTLDIIKRIYSKIEIGWVKFDNINVLFKDEVSWWGDSNVEVRHRPKENFASEIGVDNIIIKGVS